MLRLLFIPLLLVATLGRSQVSSFLHIDQFGYQPQAVKVAVLSNPEVGYNSADSYSPGSLLEVRRSTDNSVAFSAAPSPWNGGALHDQSGDRGWWFDFSGLTEEGNFYLYDPASGESSAVFYVGEDVYAEVLKAAGRMFFYNRCNAPKEAEFAGSKWSDSNNFLNNGQDGNCRYINDPSNASLEKDLTGGWFDAGDYNKYVSFTYTTLHDLLAALEENPEAFTDNWSIPESGNGLPDLLDEIKWELDWLKKMMNPDGSVHNKMGSQNYTENTLSPPSANADPRFYGPTCTSASATVASVFAHAALVLEDYPSLSSYADDLSSRAQTAFDYVEPYVLSNTLETDCDDGSIVAGDADMDAILQVTVMVTAASYLYELTGDESYRMFLESYYGLAESISTGFWSPYDAPHQDALLRHIKNPGASSSTVAAVSGSFENAVEFDYEGMFGYEPTDLYRANMPDWAYHWGSSKPKASAAVLNTVAARNQIDNDSINQMARAAEHLHYFHGVNPQGLVYLSNMYAYGAARCVNEIYHTWFYDGTDFDNALTSSNGPAPGFVTGGPNQYFSVPALSPPSGQPAQKAYLDFNDGWPNSSWEISEPAIYYQAAYLRLLANFVRQPESTPAEEPLRTKAQLFPNPASTEVVVGGLLRNSEVVLYDMQGRILDIVCGEGQVRIPVHELAEGTYLIIISDESGALRNETLVIQR